MKTKKAKAQAKAKATALRESRHVKVARIIYAHTQAVFPRYSHRFSPKKFTLPQLGACVLLAFYFKMSYRDFEELLLMSQELRAVLELSAVPDYSTLNRMYHRFRASHLDQMLDQMNEALLDSLSTDSTDRTDCTDCTNCTNCTDRADPDGPDGPDGPHQRLPEAVISFDATGYRPTTASAYFQTRRGKPFRRWLKGVYAVGTHSQLILAVTSGSGPSNDAPHWSTLQRRIRRYGQRDADGRPAWVTLADRGFDGAHLGPRDLVPPIRRGGGLKAPERQARADRVSQARLDGLFGQRWKSETVHSVIKRKFGDAVRSVKRSAQNRESRVKAVVYNAHR